MKSDNDVMVPFREFAGSNGDHYANTFLEIQQDKLSFWHVNWSAASGSFVWAALRANWLLFWVGFIVDLVAQALDLLLVDELDHLEVAQVLAMLADQLLHGSSDASL